MGTLPLSQVLWDRVAKPEVPAEKTTISGPLAFLRIPGEAVGLRYCTA
jgi:hypothetical protein